ncbi:MAG TPA: ParB/RepB/Spo0J family partition protein [Trueperaceae bacterium]|nr:ParB/RepB/Spo0J family partition protein [Trueperaceae bacterium]
MSAKARGLGRGLDALLPRVEKGVQQVAVAQLRPSPLQPRQRFDDATIAELTASVAERGVLQPIVVRPVDGGYEVVAGERRFRAAQGAGLTTVPAVVRELTDREALEIAIIENLQREDLNDIEEARAFKQLLDFELSQEQVATAVGKSRSAVANTLRLLTLPAVIQDALQKREISAGHARAILAQPERDRLWAFEQITGRGLSVRQAEQLMRPASIGAADADSRQRSRPYLRLEEDLSRHAGTRVRISGDKRGKIELHFHDEDELTRLLELLGYQA